MRLKIRGKEWKIEVLDDKSFDKLHGKRTLAITYGSKRRIVFRKSPTSRSTIIHELNHAYWYESYVFGANLKLDQVEELICETFAEFHFDISAQSKKIAKFLKK